MNWREHITVEPYVCHGKACFTGTRVLVSVVLDNLAAGLNAERIRQSYPSLTPDHFSAALPTRPISPCSGRVERLKLFGKSKAGTIRSMPRTASPVKTQQKPDYRSVRNDIRKLVERNKPRSTAGRKRIAFGWYGGKYSHLEWLLPFLPQTRQYCEPFGGSAAVLLNREPAKVETYNDLDGEVVNFFRVLRERKDDLVQAIGLTPFSRAEFALACEPPDENVSAFERARRFFVRARQVRTGLAQTASLGRWANCRNTSRAGMSGVVSRWLGSVEQLPGIAERLLRVQIENRDALELIGLYDDSETLFYCDPPYVHDTRGDSKAYGFEMSDDEHRELACKLHDVNGLVALSGYRSSLYDELYGNWERIDAPSKMCHSIKKERAEVLWVNYEVPA